MSRSREKTGLTRGFLFGPGRRPGIFSENTVLLLANCTVYANQANGATALGGGSTRSIVP